MKLNNDLPVSSATISIGLRRPPLLEWRVRGAYKQVAALVGHDVVPNEPRNFPPCAAVDLDGEGNQWRLFCWGMSAEWFGRWLGPADDSLPEAFPAAPAITQRKFGESAWEFIHRAIGFSYDFAERRFEALDARLPEYAILIAEARSRLGDRAVGLLDAFVRLFPPRSGPGGDIRATLRAKGWLHEQSDALFGWRLLPGNQPRIAFVNGSVGLLPSELAPVNQNYVATPFFPGLRRNVSRFSLEKEFRHDPKEALINAVEGNDFRVDWLIEGVGKDIVLPFRPGWLRWGKASEHAFCVEAKLSIDVNNPGLNTKVTWRVARDAPDPEAAASLPCLLDAEFEDWEEGRGGKVARCTPPEGADWRMWPDNEFLRCDLLTPLAGKGGAAGLYPLRRPGDRLVLLAVPGKKAVALGQKQAWNDAREGEDKIRLALDLGDKECLIQAGSSALRVAPDGFSLEGGDVNIW